MAYTSKVYIKANQTGLTTSSIWENGFNSGNFSGKKFIDANNPAGGEGDTPTVTTSEPSAYNTIQIGSEKDENKKTISKKGLFLEKPSLVCDSDAYFFPLGSNGTSLDVSYKARGFKYSEFLKGGVDEIEGSEFKGQTLQEIPLTSEYKCSEVFLENSPYDEKCFYDFNGVHITSDTSKYKNILKFEQDSTSFDSSAEEVTLEFNKGDYLNYTCPTSRLAQQILSIEIKDSETDEIYEDYTYSAGSITSKKAFEKATKLKLKLTFHSAFRRRLSNSANAGGVDWISGLWGSELDKEDILRDNFLQAKDAIIISNKSGISTLQFKKAINISSTGKYYFSAYMRTEKGRAKVEEICFVDGEGIKISTPYSCADIDIKEDQGTFMLTPVWKRLATLTNIEAPGKYYLSVKISDEGNAVPKVRVVGMEVTKDELPPYDYRDINYTNIDNSKFPELKKHALYFNFSKAGGSMIKSSTWAISYLRKFEGLEIDNQEHYDSIGNIVFGYSGPNIVVNNEVKKIEEFNPSDSYNGWEQVIITHEKGKDVIGIEVNTVGNYSKGEAPKTSKRYKIEVPVSSYTLDMPYTATGKYNCILGGKVEKGEIINCNGSYRNLWWFPKGLTEEELNKLRNQYLLYSQVDRTKTDGSEENTILIRSDFLWETSTY